MTRPEAPTPASAQQRWLLPVPIDTPRTRLRRHTRDDVEDLLTFHSDPQVTRYLPWPVRDRDAVVTALEQKLGQTHLDADGSWLSLAVEDRQSARVVGEALLSRMSGPAGIAEVGYVLARDVHGRGIGTEVVVALLGAAWEHLPVVEVRAHVDADNHASRRLVERLGFQHRGHKHDDRQDGGAGSSLLRYVLVREG